MRRALAREDLVLDVHDVSLYPREAGPSTLFAESNRSWAALFVHSLSFLENPI